eukprot:gene52461-70150_t
MNAPTKSIEVLPQTVEFKLDGNTIHAYEGETIFKAAKRHGIDMLAPSLLWHLDALLPMTDFVSVGTNDLMQYLFAADRGNPRVADRYDPLSPPALRALKQIQNACAETGTPVSVCGEMA